MTVSIIPAQPGFFAAERVDGRLHHLPIIAWKVVVHSDGDISVWGIGVDGAFESDTPIFTADGQRAYVEREACA